MSQSQKRLSCRLVQTYKNWSGCFGAAEQTPQGSHCLCKRDRLVDLIRHIKKKKKKNSPSGSLRPECLYAGASEPRNMAYMNRLGIWGPKTPFREFGDFIQAVERRYVYFLWPLRLYFSPQMKRQNVRNLSVQIKLPVCKRSVCGVISEVLAPWRSWQWT